jgi:predicted HD phosphohydrolase
VPAKRWLVSEDAAYRARLSVNSTATLAAQGDVFSDRERIEFEARPDFRACVALRRADDAAKVPGLKVVGLDRWERLVRDMVRSKRRRLS